MNRAALIRAALLALPLAGLGWSWLTTDRASRQGVEWEVPVEGYDPRDLLQGHYVQFQYEWPGIAANAPGLNELYGASLCLEGRPPAIVRVTKVDPKAASGKGPPCRDFAAGDFSHVNGDSGIIGGRLYVSQAEAARLQQELWNPKQQGVVRFRLRPDGHITPLGLTFRARAAEPSLAPAATPTQ